MRPWSLLLMGMPNSGKSTIAYNLVQNKIRNALIIDGDKHREMQFLGKKLGFSKEDIKKNTEHVVKMARFAQEQGMNVIIAQITPYIWQREMMRKGLDNFIEILCDCSEEERNKRPNYRDSELVFEVGEPDGVLYTGADTVEECSDLILNKIEYNQRFTYS